MVKLMSAKKRKKRKKKKKKDKNRRGSGKMVKKIDVSFTDKKRAYVKSSTKWQ